MYFKKLYSFTTPVQRRNDTRTDELSIYKRIHFESPDNQQAARKASVRIFFPINGTLQTTLFTLLQNEASSPTNVPFFLFLLFASCTSVHTYCILWVVYELRARLVQGLNVWSRARLERTTHTPPLSSKEARPPRPFGGRINALASLSLQQHVTA